MSRTVHKDPFIVQLQSYLDKHKVREALDLIRNAEVRERLAEDSEFMWDIIPVICNRLRTLNEFRFKTFGVCQEMLLDLAHICKPKEVLISLLAELENENLEMTDDINGNNKTAVSATELKYQVDDSCFKAILKPLQHILILLPKKRNETLKWVLSTLNNHVLKIPAPKDYKLLEQGYERILLEGDPTVRRLHLVLPIYLDFIEAFVEEFDRSRSQLKVVDGTFEYSSLPQKDILLKALISLFYHPLMYLDLSIEKEIRVKEMLSKSEITENNNTREEKSLKPEPTGLTDSLVSRSITSCLGRASKTIQSSGPGLLAPDLDDSASCAVRALELISLVEPNLYKIYDRFDSVHQKEMEDEEQDTNLELKPEAASYALAVAAYLTIGQGQYPTNTFVPCVYSHLYAFEKHLPHIYVLLERKEIVAHEKGLHLAERLISLITVGSLSTRVSDMLRKHPIEKSLISIMRFSCSAANRKQALSIFKLFLSRFTDQGRCQLLYRTLASPDQHTAVRGLALGLYKDLIVSEKSSPVYTGANLHRFLRKAMATCLPDGTESDLIESNDTIMGTLNLVRFLCIRDPKSENKTKIWDLIEPIQESLLKPLRNAIHLSKAHFNIELRKLKQETAITASKKRKEHQLEVDVLNGQKEALPQLPDDHESQVIKMALMKFDMMESVLVRVIEVVE